MNVENYSDNQIAIIVNAFQKYIKLIIKNSAIDFARKEKLRIVREVSYNECVIQKVSLSFCDNDAFFVVYDSFDYGNLQNKLFIKAVDKLSEIERKVISLEINGYSNLSIAQKLNLPEKAVRNAKYNAKKKLRKILRGDSK